jgi:hypothetical protein
VSGKAVFKGELQLEYTFEGLRQTVPAALDSVRNSTILGNYHSCLRKMELYRDKITYGSTEWKALSSHKRVYIYARGKSLGRVEGLVSGFSED